MKITIEEEAARRSIDWLRRTAQQDWAVRYEHDYDLIAAADAMEALLSRAHGEGAIESLRECIADAEEHGDPGVSLDFATARALAALPPSQGGAGENALRKRPLTGELADAVQLAERILDRPNGDPDDDLALLSRQFLRSQEKISTLLTLLQMSKRQRESAADVVSHFCLDCGKRWTGDTVDCSDTRCPFRFEMARAARMVEAATDIVSPETAAKLADRVRKGERA